MIFPVVSVSRRHVPGRPGGGWDDLDPVESSSSLSQDLPQSSSDCSSDLSERLAHSTHQYRSSVVRALAHGAMGRRINPSWGGPIELFLVPASAPQLV